MRFLRKPEFFAALQRSQPYDPECYFYMGRCSRLPEARLSERAGIDRLLRATRRVFSLAGPSPFIVAFNDQHAGWRGVPRNRKYSPLEVPATFDVEDFVRKHLFFRDPRNRADNYYFADPEFSWFVIFCHHGCWHVHGAKRLLANLVRV
jgi:hypothetical protein